MSLKEAYEFYLAHPAADVLSADASLNYVTTLTTIHSAASIAKHHTAHQKVVKKKGEKILDCVVGGNAITMDVETTLEFVSGGGAYLPGLDDNFVSDRVVTFPMVHIVHFDSELKIDQIRLYWDQGSLLKQIDVIGARGRNWPIRDGKDQARLIETIAAKTGNALPLASGPAPSATTSKPRAQNNNVTRDPHASLSLFAPRDEDGESNGPKVVAARATSSARPPPRDYHDLFIGHDSDASPKPNKAGPSSPKKENQAMRPPPPKAQSAKPPPRDYHDLFVGNESDHSPIAKGKPASPAKDIRSPPPPKFGAGKNYRPVRLFETDDITPGTPRSPDKSGFKTNPKKYNHFEFGNGDDAPPTDANRPKTKHQSQWDFEDFSTPVKAPTKLREQDKVNFGWEENEPVMNSPAKNNPPNKARPDADPHFEFQDDGTPSGDRRPAGQPRGAGNQRNGNLYQNHVYNEDNTSSSPEKSKPLAPVTNLQDRRKDFDAHFTMTDSPSDAGHEITKAVPEARKKVVNQMGANWDATDDSPLPATNGSASSANNAGGNNKENINADSILVGTGRPASYAGIKSGGDGMGGKKGASRQWGFGDESDGEDEQFRPNMKQQAPKDNGLWDF